ncbi:hypothetical protein [Cupriavidus necator]
MASILGIPRSYLCALSRFIESHRVETSSFDIPVLYFRAILLPIEVIKSNKKKFIKNYKCDGYASVFVQSNHGFFVISDSFMNYRLVVGRRAMLAG